MRAPTLEKERYGVLRPTNAEKEIQSKLEGPVHLVQGREEGVGHPFRSMGCARLQQVHDREGGSNPCAAAQCSTASKATRTPDPKDAAR